MNTHVLLSTGGLNPVLTVVALNTRSYQTAERLVRQNYGRGKVILAMASEPLIVEKFYEIAG